MRVAGQGDGDDDTLAHAAGKLVGELLMAASLDVTISIISVALISASALESFLSLWSRITSAICSPTVSTGFKAVIGFWKIMETAMKF